MDFNLTSLKLYISDGLFYIFYNAKINQLSIEKINSNRGLNSKLINKKEVITKVKT